MRTMPPKISPSQIDDKLDKQHAFVFHNAALIASRNGSSLRTSLRQTSSEEKVWCKFRCEHEGVFSVSQHNRILRTYGILAEAPNCYPTGDDRSQLIPNW